MAGWLTYAKAVDSLKLVHIEGFIQTNRGLSYFLFHQGKRVNLEWVIIAVTDEVHDILNL